MLNIQTIIIINILINEIIMIIMVILIIMIIIIITIITTTATLIKHNWLICNNS